MVKRKYTSGTILGEMWPIPASRIFGWRIVCIRTWRQREVTQGVLLQAFTELLVPSATEAFSRLD
jgi:hypothetical protein